MWHVRCNRVVQKLDLCPPHPPIPLIFLLLFLFVFVFIFVAYYLYQACVISKPIFELLMPPPLNLVGFGVLSPHPLSDIVNSAERSTSKLWKTRDNKICSVQPKYLLQPAQCDFFLKEVVHIDQKWVVFFLNNKILIIIDRFKMCLSRKFMQWLYIVLSLNPSAHWCTLVHKTPPFPLSKNPCEPCQTPQMLLSTAICRHLCTGEGESLALIHLWGI